MRNRSTHCGISPVTGKNRTVGQTKWLVLSAKETPKAQNLEWHDDWSSISARNLSKDGWDWVGKKFNSVAVDLLGSSDDFKICLAPVKLDVDEGLFDEFLPVSLFEISDAHCSRQSYVIPSQCKKVHNGQTLASFCTQFFWLQRWQASHMLGWQKIFKDFNRSCTPNWSIRVSRKNPRENTEQPSYSCQSFLTLWPVSMIVNHQARHQELYDVAKEASNGPISVGRFVVSIKYDTFPVLVGHFTRKT